MGAREVPPRRCKHSSAILVGTLSIPATHELGWGLVPTALDNGQRLVAEALRDEPDWRGILRVEKIEFRTGTAN